MNGLGNDYVFFHSESGKFSPSPETVAKICDRHKSVGGDGIVILEPSEVADLRMKIFNSDGSRAEMCGNALRCAARYMRDEGMCGETAAVETDAGIKNAVFFTDNERVAAVEAEIGEGRYISKSEIDYNGETIVAHNISVGNPHAVVFGRPLGEVETLGRYISENPIYPHRTNVEFAEIRDRRTVRVRVYERGAGVTMACGTGAAATAYCAMLCGGLDPEAEVILDGGTLTVALRDGRLFIKGGAEYNFFGEITI